MTYQLATKNQTTENRLVNLYQNRAWGAALSREAVRDQVLRPDNYLVIDLVGARIDAAWLGAVRWIDTEDGREGTLYATSLEPLCRASVADKRAEMLGLARFVCATARNQGVIKARLAFATGTFVANWLAERGLLNTTRTVEGVEITVFEEPLADAEAKL